MKKVTTLDPISMQDVSDIENAPYVVEGQGHKEFKIYFENEANKAVYLNMQLHGPSDSLFAGDSGPGHTAASGYQLTQTL